VVTQLRGSIPPGTYRIVITTGHFTRAAITEASRPDRNTIELVDGPELAHVLAENGIGVKNTKVLYYGWTRELSKNDSKPSRAKG
jgi:restriction endonuclease Mrr